MGFTVCKDRIRKAVLFVDPTDEASLKAMDRLKKRGIPFEVRELGSSGRGYGVGLHMACAREDGVTRFDTKMHVPILVVDWSWSDKSIEVAVFEGEVAIDCGIE